jgi:hypothetical protein
LADVVNQDDATFGAVTRFFRKFPLIASLIILELPAVSGLVTSYVADAPDVVKVIASVLAPLLAVVLLAARSVVTPTIAPKDDAGRRLVPVGRSSTLR